MKSYIKICSFITLLFLIGCSHTSKLNIIPHATIDYTNNIKDDADAIDIITDKSKDVTLHTDNIRNNVKKIDSDVTDYNKTIQDLVNENKRLNDESSRWYKKFLMSVIIVCGLSIGIGIVLFILDKLKSIVPIAIAAGLLVSAITLLSIEKYFLYIAIASSILVIFTIIHAALKTANMKKESGQNKEVARKIASAVADGVLTKEELKEIADKIENDPSINLISEIKNKLDTKQ